MYLTGAPCPLTELELRLRSEAGGVATTAASSATTSSSRSASIAASPSTQVGVYVVAFVPNVVGYGLLAIRARRNRADRVPLAT